MTKAASTNRPAPANNGCISCTTNCDRLKLAPHKIAASATMNMVFRMTLDLSEKLSPDNPASCVLPFQTSVSEYAG